MKRKKIELPPMHTATCVVCNTATLFDPRRGGRDPKATKYWSYNDDDSLRPYCSAECSLVDYERRRKNADKSSST